MRVKGLALLMMLLVAILVSACGAEDDGDSAAAGDEGAESTERVENDNSDESGESEQSGEIDVEHAQGTTPVPLNPQTVVVFDYSTLDTLDQLGVEVAGVPKGSSVPPFLSDYESDEYVNVGTLFEPDYEQVNALDPDLIIVAGRSSTVYEDLANMAPTIDLTVDQENFLESFKERTMALAEIFEKEAEVEERLAEIDEAVARVQEAADAEERKGLIVMVSGGEITAYGPGSRFGMVHDLLGVPAAADDVEAATHGDAISFEFIQERNPDLLYVIDRDVAIGDDSGEAAEEVLDNELVQSTSAWSNDAVTYLDPAKWYLANAGLGTFASMVEEIETSLQ